MFRTFRMYQQRAPRRDSCGDFHAELVEVGVIEARNSSEAIDLAKKLLPFVTARRGLEPYPIVQELTQ